MKPSEASSLQLSRACLRSDSSCHEGTDCKSSTETCRRPCSSVCQTVHCDSRTNWSMDRDLCTLLWLSWIDHSCSGTCRLNRSITLRPQTLVLCLRLCTGDDWRAHSSVRPCQLVSLMRCVGSLRRSAANLVSQPVCGSLAAVNVDAFEDPHQLRTLQRSCDQWARPRRRGPVSMLVA